MTSAPTARQLQNAYMFGNGQTVEIDMGAFFQSFGRHAPFAFATAAFGNEDVLNGFAGTSVGQEIVVDEIRLSNFIADVHSSDYLDRALGYGDVELEFVGSVVNVNGELRLQGYLTVVDENYDFVGNSDNSAIEFFRAATGFLLDPLGTGTSVPIRYTGTPLFVDLSSK